MDILRNPNGEYDVHVDDTNRDMIVWRYMDYWKFQQLVEMSWFSGKWRTAAFG
jgi:hypothetical protein